MFQVKINSDIVSVRDESEWRQTEDDGRICTVLLGLCLEHCDVALIHQALKFSSSL